jgi:hypothetical protein
MGLFARRPGGPAAKGMNDPSPESVEPGCGAPRRLSLTMLVDRAMQRFRFVLAGLATLMATPAIACPMMQTTVAPGGAAQTAAPGCMCGSPAVTAAQATPGQQGAQLQQGGCSCCRTMAMQMSPNQGMPGMGGQLNSPSAPTSPPTAPEQQPGRQVGTKLAPSRSKPPGSVSPFSTVALAPAA